MVLAMTVVSVGMPVPATADAPPPPTETIGRDLDGLPVAEEMVAAADAGVRSEAVEAPIPFSMIAFTAPEGATVEVRTSADGETWQDWAEAETLEDVPDKGSADAELAHEAEGVPTEPLWVGEARWLQTRVTGGSPAEVTTHLVDSMGLSRSFVERARDAVRAAWNTTPTTAHAAAGKPDIVSRAEWGANESYRRGTATSASRPGFAVFHHTAGTNNYSQAEAPGVVRGVYYYHAVTRGWSDVGYNFLVDRYGTIYEGRAGGVDKAVIGAHVGGFNSGSIGVSVMGNFDTAQMPEAAKESVARLLAWKLDLHHIDVDGSVKVTSQCSVSCKVPAGMSITIPTVVGHRDLGLSSCPGRYGYAQLPWLRDRIRQLQGAVLVAPYASATSVSLLSGGGIEKPIDFGVQLQPAGEWTFEIKSNDGDVVYSNRGEGSSAKVTWGGSDGLEAGTYWWVFASPGRTRVVGSFRLVKHLHLRDAYVTPATVLADATGFTAPITVGVRLDPPGSWDLELRTNQGEVVLHETGSGAEAQVRWAGRSGLEPGLYWYVFTSPDRERAVGTFTVERAPFQPPFWDDDTSVHQPAIADLAQRGITKGCAKGRFCPSGHVSRGQMASFLSRTMSHMGRAPGASPVDHFADDNGSVHEGAINALAQDGVTAGCRSGQFCPSWDITRNQIAEWLAKAFSLQPSGVDHFTDDNGSDYEWAINALADRGLTLGCADRRYCGGASTSRGQMAAFLSRAIAELSRG